MIRQAQTDPKAMKYLSLAVALAATVAACSGEGAGKQASKQGAAPSYPVETRIIEARPVEYLVAAVGSVNAFEEISVSARVAGVVEKVRFVEGDTVDKGAVLAEIEPERYRVQVESAKASLQRAHASLKEAESALQRREELNRTTPNLVREEELATYRAQAGVAAADVAQANAALDLAELNLRDAYVRAPVSGIIQTRGVQTGQYVQTGTVLATLLQQDPLLLRFDVPEVEARRVSRGDTAWFRVSGAEGEHKAEIIHVASAAEASTRMVPITARVESTGNRAVRPGAFAQVRVPVGGNEKAIVVPRIAVRTSERGYLAYIVEDGKAVERQLELGMRTSNDRIEVREGLREGERLVIRGAEALRPGVLTHEVAAREGGRPLEGAEQSGGPQ